MFRLGTGGHPAVLGQAKRGGCINVQFEFELRHEASVANLQLYLLYLNFELFQVEPGRWEIVASSLEELEAFGAKLGRSLKAADKNIAGQVCVCVYNVAAAGAAG